MSEPTPTDGAGARGSGGKISEYIKALNDEANAPPATKTEAAAPTDGAAKPNGSAEHSEAVPPVKRKLRLLERISGVKA